MMTGPWFLCLAQVTRPVSPEPAPPTLPDPGPKGVSRAARSLVPSGPGSVAWPGLRPSGWGGKADGPRHSPGAVGFRAVRTEGCRPSTAAGGLGHGFMLSLRCLGRGHRVGWGPSSRRNVRSSGQDPSPPRCRDWGGVLPPGLCPLVYQAGLPWEPPTPGSPWPRRGGGAAHSASAGCPSSGP